MQGEDALGAGVKDVVKLVSPTLLAEAAHRRDIAASAESLALAGNDEGAHRLVAGRVANTVAQLAAHVPRQ